MTRRRAPMPDRTQCRWKTGGRPCLIRAQVHPRGQGLGGHWCAWHFAALRHPGWGYSERYWREWVEKQTADYGTSPYGPEADLAAIWARLSGHSATPPVAADRQQEAISP